MFRKFLLIPSLLVTVFSSYGQTAKLSLEKGKKYEMTSVIKFTTSTEVMGQQMETNASDESSSIIEILDVRGPETDLSVTVKSMNTNLSSMGQEMSYNSADKNSSGPLAETMSKTIDVPKLYTIDNKGNTLKSDKPAETDDGPGQILSGLKKESDLSFLNRAVLDREMKTGDTWPDSISTNDPKIKTTTIGTYQVKSIEGGNVILLYNGIQKMTGTMEQMGMEMTITGTNKIQSEITMELATGLLTNIKSNVEITSNVDAGGMTIPTTGKNTTIHALKAL